jgi:tetratricopeptide (TPR) repeat protein
VYANIAPASAHANHMPSHLFTRVGAWDESISSNLKSAELATAAESGSKNGEARDQRLHAMDYLEYAYLQSGRSAKAKAVLEEMNTLPPVSGLTLTGGYALAAIPARYAIELGNWEEASQLQVREDIVPWAQAITWAAIGVGSARAHKLDQAKQAEAKLAALRDAIAKQNNSYWSDQVEVQRREVAAWAAEQSGRPEQGVSLMRSAVDLEESMDKSPVTPGSVTPAREMLAELLIMHRQAKEALAEYEAVLKTAPNRFDTLYGAARAAEESGDGVLAATYFRKLTEVAVGDERPELSVARKKLLTAKARVTAP